MTDLSNSQAVNNDSHTNLSSEFRGDMVACEFERRGLERKGQNIHGRAVAPVKKRHSLEDGGQDMRPRCRQGHPLDSAAQFSSMPNNLTPVSKDSNDAAAELMSRPELTPSHTPELAAKLSAKMSHAPKPTPCGGG